MRRTTLKPAEAARIRDEWLSAVDALRQQVRKWAGEQGWTVTEVEREVTEEELGTYKVRALSIEAPQGELILDPVARFVMGAAGRVDLSVWPSLYRVMLLRAPGPDWVMPTESPIASQVVLDARETMTWQWVVRTESGIDWPHPWGQHTFVDLAKRLLRVA